MHRRAATKIGGTVDVTGDQKMESFATALIVLDAPCSRRISKFQCVSDSSTRRFLAVLSDVAHLVYMRDMTER